LKITDNLGNIIEEYEYDLFWKPYSRDLLTWKITNLKKSSIWNTRLYTWREFERWLQLYYNRARYYNPELGRFISRDPIDIADDINLYAYVGNNPIGFVDLMVTEKKATAEQFRIDFVKAYDEFLIVSERLRKSELDLDIARRAPMIFWKKDYINRMQNNYNNVLNDYNIKENIAKELHYSRNEHNIDLPKTLKEAEKIWWIEPKLLWSKYLASYYHQDWEINWAERKFISPDWHKEIIFSRNWEEITSNKYGGTYNIYWPDNKELHIKYDIHRYNKWWNWNYFID